MDRVGNSHGSPLLAPGDVLTHRYRIRGPVGNGGLAWVWEAEDLQESSLVAIKQFKRSSGAPLADLARREAELLGCISHAGIPRLLGRGEAGGVPYLVLELVRGWSMLEAYEHRVGPLNRADIGPLRWPEPGRFALRLTAIVAALHEHGLVHRDINLHNVMTRKCRDGWEPVLVDLGLGCKRAGASSKWGSCLAGNLRTLAPEQIERRAIGRDPRTDVYQLGLVFYRLLTGVDAFAGIDMLVERILAGDFPYPREVDAGVDRRLEGICLRALARDPDRRPATASQMLESIAEAVPPAVRPLPSHGTTTGSRAAAGGPEAARVAGRPRAVRLRGWHAATGT